MMKRVLSITLTAVLIGACSLLLPSGQAMTMEVDGVPVTCEIRDSSIEGADPLGPEAQTECASRAREAMGTVLGAQPSAQIESVSITANGAATVCYTVAGVRSCPQVLPAMPTL